VITTMPALLRRHPRETTLLAALLALFLLPFFGVDGFYAVSTFRSLAIDNLPVLLAAAGMTLVIVAGQIDISIGSQFVVGGIAAGLLAKSGLPMPLVVLATLAIGAALGAINGLLVSVARIPAIIATLATMVLLRNGVLRATGGDWIQDLPAGFQWFGLPSGVAQLAYLAAAAALFGAFAWAMRHTSAGRAFYAVGCDHEAARRIGLNPSRQIVAAFAVLGVATALAALLNFTRYPTIETNAGLGFELKVIAAVVVGGASITGGRGSLLGTLLGVALLGSIGTVFTFLHVDPAWEKAIQGAILLVAVVADTAFRKEAARA
jgi:rhamnose transport system permease protein